MNRTKIKPKKRNEEKNNSLCEHVYSIQNWSIADLGIGFRKFVVKYFRTLYAVSMGQVPLVIRTLFFNHLTIFINTNRLEGK